MKKKIVIMLLTFISIFCIVIGLAACGKNSGNDESSSETESDTNVTVNGTYYYCENDVLDDELYITFKDGNWTDDENQSGKYTLVNNVITLYIGKTKFASGVVKGDDITLEIMGTNWVYRKGDDIDPNKPKTKTLSYVLSQDGTYYIVKGIGELTGDIVIPNEYKKKPVAEIAENAFANCSSLTSIVIGDNVTTVGAKAFYKCSNLKKATLGESVNAIAESTFEECRKLESITISAGVKSIAEKAFYYCLALKDIYYTGTVGNWAEIDFYYSKGFNSIKISNPLSDNIVYIVGNNTAYVDYRSRNLYIDGNLLTDAVITEVESISPFAFYGYHGLSSVKTGGMVTEIGEYAFCDCSELATLEFEDSHITKIGEGAFDSCTKLQSVTIPDSVERLEKYSFNSCEELSTVTIGNRVVHIEYGAFMSCEKLSSLTIGSSVLEIHEAAFYACRALTSVYIPESVIFIGKDAFFSTGLTSVKFAHKADWTVNKDVPLASEELEDEANAAKLLTNSILVEGYADTDWERQTLQYKLSEDGTYYIVSNIGRTCRSEIVIPETYNGKPVRMIGSWAFEECSNLVSITIPDSVTIIGEYAFYSCSNLTSITIPNSVTSIGMGTFSGGCTGLTSITIPNSVTSIGEYAFSSCRSLTSITIPNSVTSIGEYAFSGCSSLKAVYIEDLSAWCKISFTDSSSNPLSYAKNLYLNNKLVTELVIPSDVTKINAYAFYNCSNLTSVTIGNSVTSIGDRAFYECTSLASVTIGNSVTSIGDSAFYECTSLASVTIGNSVTSIGSEAFQYCSSLTSITIPDSVTSIGSEAFSNCSNLTSVTIGNSVTSIGYDAFYYCSNLTSIVIPNSVTSIGNSAFYGCNNLQYNEYDNGYYLGNNENPYYVLVKVKNTDITSCNINENTGIIYYNAFYNCKNLTSITIPNSVISIGLSAFDNCNDLKAVYIEDLSAWCKITFGNKYSNPLYYAKNLYLNNKLLTELVIPSNITKINAYAFYNCSNLTSITIGNSVTSIGDSAFYGCSSLTSVAIPNSVTSIGDSAFGGCSSLESITLPFVGGSAKTSSDTYQYPFGYIFGTSSYEGGVATKQYYYGYSTSSATDDTYYIPASLKSVTITGGNIPYGAFYNCKGLTSIIIPDSVTSIGDSAFCGCSSLTSITIPNGVTRIGSYAFRGCTGITSITIPNGVTSIGSYAFDGCSGLTSVTFENTSDWYAEKTKKSFQPPTVIKVNVKTPSVAARYLTDEYKDWRWSRQ